ncbi:hypothetical protein LCGC14_0458790 [marine sediment metagenome]|uniref:Uncharacterized protein n=1 Tax=marine sediment metagenome TaxID=412755 RepID=A0A0F9V2J2_9ZZZZ
MKKLIKSIILILLFGTSVHGWEIEGRISQMLYNDPEIRAGNSIEIRAKHKGLFIFGEQDNLLMYGNYFDIDSIGLGFEQEIADGFLGYLKVGYYMPQYDKNNFSREGLGYAQNRYWVPTHHTTWFDYYNVEFDSNIGGEMGFDFNRRIWKSLYLGISAGYRYLKINEFICGWNDGGAPGLTGWIMEQNRDFGGYKAAALIEWRF